MCTGTYRWTKARIFPVYPVHVRHVCTGMYVHRQYRTVVRTVAQLRALARANLHEHATARRDILHRYVPYYKPETVNRKQVTFSEALLE